MRAMILFCMMLAFLLFSGCNPNDFGLLPPQGMKQIPGGTFQMGDTLYSVEQPVHSVTVSSFYMDTTEVTQGDYLALMGVHPRYCFCDSGSLWPENGISWFEAVLYCNARSKRDGLDTVYSYDSVSLLTYGLAGLAIDFAKNGYRLPTEAEWEYACRAGTMTDYYWGGSFPPTTLADTLTIDSNAVWREGNNGPKRVGGKRPNAFGLYDMIGNAYEWCNDWYDAYSAGAQTDPTGSSSGLYRMLRGGLWLYTDPVCLRSAWRFRAVPFDGSTLHPGFRCVRR